jgi:hypothetical protein
MLPCSEVLWGKALLADTPYMNMRDFCITTVMALAVSLCFLPPRSTHAQSSPTPRPSATATKTPEPTPTPQKTGKCCWCVLPDDGQYSEDESRRLYDYCDRCLMDPTQNPKAVGCDVSYNTSPSRFQSHLEIAKSRGECPNQVYVANNLHGPIFDTVSNLVSVCVKAFPSCSIEIDDRSCETLRNEKEAQMFLTSLQSEIGDEGSVTLCGNSSSNFGLTCGRLAASKRFVVTKYSLTDETMRCNREGRTCSPIGDSWQCLDFGKRLITQKCCGGTNPPFRFGMWVNNAECNGEDECPERCKKEYGIAVYTKTCVSPTKARAVNCSELSGGGHICSNFELECNLFHICKDGECVEESFAALPTPTAVATVSAMARAKTAKAVHGGGRTPSQLGSISPVKGVPYHFLADAATLHAAFTPQLFFGSSHMSEFEGIGGVTGIALIKVDPVSTIGMVGLKAGDVIHYVNDQPIETESDIFDALAQSRTRTFITYSRMAPKEEAETTSVLPKPARWNWIVTIHAEEKDARSGVIKGREYWRGTDLGALGF